MGKRKPGRPSRPKGYQSVHVWLPEPLVGRLREIAQTEQRSLTVTMERLLLQAVKGAQAPTS